MLDDLALLGMIAAPFLLAAAAVLALRSIRWRRAERDDPYDVAPAAGPAIDTPDVYPEEPSR